uniref:ERO1-like protein beta n=1 Tax=Styela clava TaxID=7725 RepID=UPI00193A87C7|nr:ERO1-like protein beta [Styela clava]
MVWKIFLLQITFLCSLYFFPPPVSTGKNEKCFCQLSGMVDDCFCDIETLESFNNEKVYPLISKLIERDFFRYYKANLFKECFLWDGDRGLCGSESCGVKVCDENDLPIGLRPGNFNKFSENIKDCEKSESLGHLNSTLSNITLDSLDKWDKHDDEEQNFCDLDDETSIDLNYIDLLNNPERYTGYKGPLAWRIWKAIYEENCFPSDSMTKKQSNPILKAFATKEEDGGSRSSFFHTLSSSASLQGMCLEKRVFYRVVSGLHSSINIHLCANYQFKDGWDQEYWGPNLDEFQRRFDPEKTNGEGTLRLKNLYFIYLLELRALSKVASYFTKDNIFLFTGNPTSDVVTKRMLIDLLQLTKEFPMHFDEGILFQDKNSKGLKREFRERFRNITRIIDCVTCEKCRLWGKLQTQGLGTALKILFTSYDKLDKFHLRRQEIVSLVNAFARLSNSINNLELFRQMLTEAVTNDVENKSLKYQDEL